ncbi:MULTISPECIES: hypothetical protein [unclassified Streptomyces]
MIGLLCTVAYVLLVSLCAAVPLGHPTRIHPRRHAARKDRP